MSRINFTIPRDEALDVVKEAISSKVAILKEDGYNLKVGAPMMTATIAVGNDFVDISGNSIMANTCSSAISLALKKAEKQAQATAPAPAQATVQSNTDSASKPKASGLDEQIKAATLLKSIHELFELNILTKEQYEDKKKELINKLEIVSFEETLKSGKCPYCGEEVTEDMAFCGNCGNKLR